MRRDTGESDADQADLAVIGRRDRRLGAANRLENLVGGSDQGLAAGRVSRTERVLRSNKRRPQLALEVFDRAAQRWLRDVQPVGCSAEVEFLGDGEERLQLCRHPWRRPTSIIA